MEQLIITLEGKTNADLLMRLLSKFNFVKSVTREKTLSTNASDVANEPTAEYNWTNPSRPATDEEIEQMLDECEKSPCFTTKEAKAYTYKKLEEWHRKK